MKRALKSKPKNVHRTGDVKKDLNEKQLASLGAAILAYNLLEDEIDTLLLYVTGISRDLFDEVSSRINGLEGKTAIIIRGLDMLGFDQADFRALREGINLFSYYKKLRDGIVHARIINASVGIGIGRKQRGKSPDEILLSESALPIFYDHIVALRQELNAAGELAAAMTSFNSLEKDDPKRLPYEEALSMRHARYRDFRRHRKSLKPLPQFPTESELNEAESRWRAERQAELMGWFQPFSLPAQRATFVLTGLEVTEPVLPPPNEPQK